MNKQTFFRAIFLAGFVTVAACSSEPELTNEDPANCDQMKDMPEMYEECMNEMDK